MTDASMKSVYAWTVIAAILALVGFLLMPWWWAGILPLAWLFWVMGRRIAGVGPDE